MELTKYLGVLVIIGILGLSGCIGGEKQEVSKNLTNESVSVNASPDVAANDTPPAIPDVTVTDLQNISQMVKITKIKETTSMNPDIGKGLFVSDIVFDVENIWDNDIDLIDVFVLEKGCVGEPTIDFASQKSFTFKNLPPGENEEFLVKFIKFEGYVSGQKFTCPINITVQVGTERMIDTIEFDIIVP